MSASSTPTLAPESCSDAARLTAMVDLPTPPFPDATATMCFTPGIAPVRAPPLNGVRTFAVILRSTAVTPGRPLTRSCASAWKRSRTGQAGVVSSKVKLTLPSSVIARSLIMPRLTTSRPRSGSLIADSTARTSSLLGTEDHRSPQCNDAQENEERDNDCVQADTAYDGRAPRGLDPEVSAGLDQRGGDTNDRDGPKRQPRQDARKVSGRADRDEEHDDQQELQRREVTVGLVQAADAVGGFRTVTHQQGDQRRRTTEAGGEKQAAQRTGVAPDRLVADAQENAGVRGEENPDHGADHIECAIQDKRQHRAAPPVAEPRLGRRHKREHAEYEQPPSAN